MQKTLLFFLFFLTSLSLAQTCPSVKDLKKIPTGWKLMDADERKPLDARRTAYFQKNAREFALAEWEDKHNKNNAIHCYYRDRNGSNLEAFLTKNYFHPKNVSNWYHVSGAMQCAVGSEQCEFKSVTPLSQLATK